MKSKIIAFVMTTIIVLSLSSVTFAAKKSETPSELIKYVTVNGKVTNQNGYPIEGATVVFEEKNITVITGADGTFSAKMLPGTYKISVKHNDIYPREFVHTYSSSANIINENLRVSQKQYHIMIEFYFPDGRHAYPDEVKFMNTRPIEEYRRGYRYHFVVRDNADYHAQATFMSSLAVGRETKRLDVTSNCVIEWKLKIQPQY